MSLRIALVGPDGAGKSTICRKLCAALPEPAEYMYMGTNFASSNVLLPTSRWCLRWWNGRPSARSSGEPPALAEDRPRGKRGVLAWFKTLVRMTNLMAEEWYRHWVCARAQRRGATVVMDRHFYFDYYAHDVTGRERRRHVANRFHGWMLRRLYPRPDLVIFLNADAGLLWERKPEGTFEQVRRRRQEYVEAQQTCPNSVVLDAAQPVDKVVGQALSAIEQFRSQRRTTKLRSNAVATDECVAPARTSAGSVRSAESVVRATSRAPAVVVGLDCYTGLQAARILADRGIPTIGIAENPRHFACRTRACRRIITAPLRSEGLIDALEQLADTLPGPAVLVPCVDLSVLLIAQHAERLKGKFAFGAADANLVETLMDKARFHRLAVDAGLRVPDTYVVKNLEEVKRAAARISYPCLLKPSLKTESWESEVKTKVFRLTSADELLEAYRRSRHASPVMTVQAWIEGSDEDLFTCHAYFDRHSRPLATLVSHKVRQWPPEIGVGCFSRTCHDPRVADVTIQLYRSLGFHGLGYLEMKRDARTGEYVLIEANVGRQTGRSSLAEAAGVELLQTMYCDLLGLPLPADRTQRSEEAMWMYWRKDVQSALHYWRQGKLTPWQWWRAVRRCKLDAVFSWRDPLPFLGDLWYAMRWRRKRAKKSQAVAARPKAGLT